MSLSNDYLSAIEVDRFLFAVQLSDGGWSIADGPGSKLSPDDERELAGWHVPVRFTDKDSAVAAILSGPDAWFDIALESTWVQHCIARGGVVANEYL